MPFLAFLHLDFSNNELNTSSTGLQKISNLNELTRLSINLNRFYILYPSLLCFFIKDISNELGNEGAENIREGLKKSEFISSLSLHLQRFFNLIYKLN